MTPLRILAVLTALMAVTACGVDGAPERPEPRPQGGIAITGTTETGATGGV
jgi:hypothetical protein